MDLPKRKQNRLREWDYSAPGAYFVTICTKGKKKLFGEVVGGMAPRHSPTAKSNAPQMVLFEIGGIADKYIQSTNNIPEITVDKYIIMPNHIHLLLRIEKGTSRAPSPTNQILPHAISTFKRFVNRDVGCSIFQRSFHDHIIRNEADYRRIWEYIDTNPMKWKEDCFYTE